MKDIIIDANRPIYGEVEDALETAFEALAKLSTAELTPEWVRVLCAMLDGDVGTAKEWGWRICPDDNRHKWAPCSCGSCANGWVREDEIEHCQHCDAPGRCEVCGGMGYSFDMDEAECEAQDARDMEATYAELNRWIHRGGR